MVRVTQSVLVAHATAGRDDVRAALAALDQRRPLEEQTEAAPDGCLDHRSAACHLRLWSDEAGLYWVVGVGERGAVPRPSETDRWHARREWLMWLIDNLRVLVPLLDRRVRESGHAGAFDLSGVQLRLARENGRSEVTLLLPASCADAEAARLIAIVASCVHPVPGWQLTRDENQRPMGAVLEPTGIEVA